MLTVVPIGKVESPLVRRFDRSKGLAWVPRAVLEGAKQTLGIGVVIADRWPAKRGHDAQALQRAQHGCPLHGAAIVGMQHQLISLHTVGQTCFLKQYRGMPGGLLGVNLPGHNLAAINIDYQVQAQKLAFNPRGQKGDVPAPHLVWLAGFPRPWSGNGVGSIGLAPTIGLSVFMQYPVKTGFRCKVNTAVCQNGNNLRRGQALKFRAVAGLKNLLPLRIAERVVGPACCACKRSAVLKRADCVQLLARQRRSVLHDKPSTSQARLSRAPCPRACSINSRAICLVSKEISLPLCRPRWPALFLIEPAMLLSRPMHGLCGAAPFPVP